MSDELIWSVISTTHCAFQAKPAGTDRPFCRNPYSVDGMCNKTSCPLAHGKYATIREEEGKCFLCIKTPERAHTPINLWEKIELPKNYKEALKVINEQLQYWPHWLRHKNKQRLTKIHQYFVRVRRMKLRPQLEYVRIHQKVERRERTREKKALSAAKIESRIEEELIERLKQGTYQGLYDFPEEKEADKEEEEESEKEYEREFVEDLDVESDLEDAVGSDDDSDDDDRLGKPSKKRQKTDSKMNIEYEPAEPSEKPMEAEW